MPSHEGHTGHCDHTYWCRAKAAHTEKEQQPMNTHTSLGRRIVAALGAAALGVVGLAGVASAADEPLTGAGNINPDTATSLTINKFDGGEGKAGDGTKQDTSGFGNPLAGVTFSIQKVETKGGQAINLDTPEGWDLIKGVTADQVTEDPYALGTAQSVTTGADGTISAALPHGLYYVTETGHGDHNIVSETAPFLVTLPLPQKDGNWLYDVNVYPKNQVLGAPEKTINKDEDQTGVKVGDTVEYTINQLVPRLNEGEEYTQAVIYDILKADELKYAATTSVSLNGTVLVEGTDYTIAADGSSWTLTEDGLKKIKAGDTLTVVFTAKVLKVTETGVVANGPGNGEPGKPGYGSTFNGTTTPGGPTPYTYWGQLIVTKVDEGGNNLADAEFSVFAKTGDSCAADLPSGDPVATGKSDATGVVRWNSTPTSPLGLWIANSNDGPLTNPTRDYCLYETKAPAGYVLDTNAKTVTISAGTVNAFTQKVTNVQQDHPKLPLTGANGQMLALIGGGALVLLAGGTALVARKRSHRD